MITEDYVSFETAKLLKEKGFDEPVRMYIKAYIYPPDTAIQNIKKVTGVDLEQMEDHFLFNAEDEPFLNSVEGKDKTLFAAPTLQMAMKWLREKHNQNVTVKAINNVIRLKTVYYAEVQNLLEPGEKGFCVNGCIFKDTYEESVEYVIKYCLENLI